jgi:WD40 repeat protein
VSPALAARLSRAVVSCYPPRWKQRYREEILDVLDQHQASSRTVLSLAGANLGGIIRDSSWHPNPASGADAMALAPDQRLLATEVGGEPTAAVVTLWSVGHAGVRRLSAFEGGVTVAIAPDGRLLATSAFGGQAALWNVARPRHPARLAVLSAGSSSRLWGEAFSPDSGLLAAAYGAGVTLWNVARPAHAFRVATMSGPKGAGWFTALAFAPGGALLAGVTTSGTVLVYSLDHPARPDRTAIRRSLVTRALFPDGQAATSGAPTGCPGCLVPGYALGFAPGGRALTVVMVRIMLDNSSRDTVLTWQVTGSGALRDGIEAARNTRDGEPALAPDGRTVIDGQAFGSTRVRLWEAPATAGEPG